MKIKFKNIEINNFLSIGQATIKLDNLGFTSIIGINNNPVDNATSNGSGKSSIINAIAWTLVGETTSGITTNVVNMFSDGGCKCVLDFDIDNHSYKIIRTREDKELGTNLFLYVDEENKSGKGLKETQAILSQILPDVTIEFLSSVILLSQGLPYKFTNNTPSGRKNLLEKLSKSDYMINDLTNRVSLRITSLNLEKRKIEDENIK